MRRSAEVDGQRGAGQDRVHLSHHCHGGLDGVDGIAAALASLASPASCTGCAAICRLDFGAAILWRLHFVFSVCFLCLQRSISSCCCCWWWWLPCCGLSIIFGHGGAARPFSMFPPATTAAQFFRAASMRVRALPSPSPAPLNSTLPRYEEGDLDCPRFAGDDPVSRFVSALIAIKPLFNIMKVGARQVLIRTAEKNGVSWRGMSDQILASDVYAEKELLENQFVVYPDYYLREFHAYEEGNLSWKAASEVAPATLSMMLRAIPTAQSAEEASQILRGGWLQAIGDHHQMHSGGLGVSTVLDIGCSIGDSTRALAEWFPSAHITGLDLSPYFLAVAQHMEKQRAAAGIESARRISWLHANGECTGLPAASIDVVSFAFVIHECPQHATRGLLKEAFRVLKPGGTVSLTDNSPKSKVIQNLPPAIFTLMKSTEPWMDEYYTFDLEGEMEKIGFSNVNSILTDPRHRTVTGTVPLE